MSTKNFRIHAATYNVATFTPKGLVNLREFIGQDLDDGHSTQPDMYVFGFQEISFQPQNVAVSVLYEEPWLAQLKTALCGLPGDTYVCIRCESLVGLLLCVFVLQQHVTSVSDIHSSVVRLGLAGYWGNKGAVAISMRVHGVSVCVINSHLAPHSGQLDKRIEHYNSIVDQLRFEPGMPEPLNHDYVLWIGDLNFRLADNHTPPVCDKSDSDTSHSNSTDSLSDEQVIELSVSIVNGATSNVPALMRYDELLEVRNNGTAFASFHEQNITFPPTYKLIPNSGDSTEVQYDNSRRPAWTDRILYCTHDSTQQLETPLSVEMNNYRSHRQMALSDHHPVSARLTLQVHDHMPADFVQFVPVCVWLIGQDFVATYHRTTADNCVRPMFSSWDWIAVYRCPVRDLKNYVAYVWSSSNSIGTSRAGSRHHYTVCFPDDSITRPGEYVLAYMAPGYRGVHSFSESFTVQYP